MSTEINSAELLARKRHLMPSDLADLHFRLRQDLVWINLTWQEYKTLFSTSEERVALMNATAARFFARYEELVWHDTILSLCRLTDPPDTMGHKNATVARLPGLIAEPELAVKVEDAANACVESTVFARDWRNRRLAHRDLAHALDPEAAPLLQATRGLVEAAMERLAAALNIVELHYENATTAFNTVIVGAGAEELLHVLALGQATMERKK